MDVPPVVAAPTAGGPSTPALVAAVGDAGGLGFLAGGYRDPVELRDLVRETRLRTTAPFGVNLFVPVERLHRVGSRVWVTVTNTDEARAAASVGADAIVVQGHEAGGHRATHDACAEPNRLDHLGLLPLAAAAGLPMVAAGGVTTAGDLARAVAAGARAVAAGTAFLLCDEAGTNPAHRHALGQERQEVLTRCWSGRVARGLANDFTHRQDGHAPAVFPQVDALTRPLRRRANDQGDAEGTSLWAGIGWRAAKAEPARDIVARLCAP